MQRRNGLYLDVYLVVITSAGVSITVWGICQEVFDLRGLGQDAAREFVICMVASMVAGVAGVLLHRHLLNYHAERIQKLYRYVQWPIISRWRVYQMMRVKDYDRARLMIRPSSKKTREKNPWE
ncbi:hypothetical protein KW800_01310 [Candidatus Parcubacteria bacterium]|nr:hypothetical protein [Candidatus Parcubacteria bacterium]